MLSVGQLDEGDLADAAESHVEFTFAGDGLGDDLADMHAGEVPGRLQFLEHAGCVGAACIRHLNAGSQVREADVGGAGWQQLIDRTECLVDLRGVHARKPLAHPGSQAFEFRYERLLCLAGGLTPGIGDFSSEFLDLTAVSEKVTGREQVGEFSARVRCVVREAIGLRR